MWRNGSLLLGMEAYLGQRIVIWRDVSLLLGKEAYPGRWKLTLGKVTLCGAMEAYLRTMVADLEAATPPLTLISHSI